MAKELEADSAGSAESIMLADRSDPAATGNVADVICDMERRCTTVEVCGDVAFEEADSMESEECEKVVEEERDLAGVDGSERVAVEGVDDREMARAAMSAVISSVDIRESVEDEEVDNRAEL